MFHHAARMDTIRRVTQGSHGARTAAGQGRTTVEKEEALGSAVAQIEKQFGKGAIMRMGDPTRVAVEAIPTGSLSLDIALGIGG